MMTASKTAFASLGLLCGLGLLITACPASLDDHCAEGACVAATSPGEGGMDAAPGDGGPDASVDPCVEKPTDPACLDENTALFVSAPNGNDADATGATGKPFKTIGGALARITAAKRRIYICDGTYAEDLALTAAHNGVSLIGGIDCAFKVVSANKPVIGASANPVKIDGTTGLAIADVAVEAKDATTGSSIAVFVNGGDVTLSRARLIAGKGFKGDNGVLAPFTFPLVDALKGNDGKDMNKGGAPMPFPCPGGAITTGGKGGDLGASGATGTPGTPNPGTLSNCAIDVNGHAGTQPPVAPGATLLGSLSATGWEAQSGPSGANGIPGQGGGGGYGNGGGGGGGGAGGCGGAGGPGGKGGGASIALAASNAHVSLVASLLQSKNAGAGGGGVLGQTGQTTFGARGSGFNTACNGGNGGIGGDGAAGGGGAGGISIGVLYTLHKPIIDSATEQQITVGTKGSPGPAAPGFTNMGIDGKAAPILESN
jgi:hypothetical protein